MSEHRNREIVEDAGDVDRLLSEALAQSKPRPAIARRLDSLAEALGNVYEELSELRHALDVAAREEMRRPSFRVTRIGDDLEG